MKRISGSEDLGLMVCANGAVLWDASGNALITETFFARDGLQGCIRALRAAERELAFAVLTSDRMFVEPRYLGDGDRRDRELVDDICDVVSCIDVVSVAVRHPDLGAEAFFGSVESGFAGVGSASFSGTRTVDVAPAGISKVTAVARVVEASGHRPHETVVFGDMPNDLPLFSWAGYSVAVANAAPAVKAAADEITASNDDDGIAHTILEILGSSRE